jgi:Ca2+/Na+ antiporter
LFFLVLSIATGVEWLEFIVVLMIDMLNFLQALTGFSDLLMGMTILGISNSFVDLFIDRALALQGYEILAVTGIFAGQMFNFLVGFGTSAVIKNFKGAVGNKFHLYSWKEIFTDHNKDQMLTFGILVSCFICLLSLLIRLPITK